jgi:hypothetical protein
MKLRYKGGNIEKVRIRDPKTNRYITEERDQLSQLFEETLYEFPKPGSVMSVPSNIGGWLVAKLGKHLEVMDEPPETSPVGAARRISAVVPEEVRAAPAAEKKPSPQPSQGTFTR